MKNIFIATVLIAGFLAIPILVSAESPCNYEFIKFGRKYCVMKAEGRRGSANYKPSIITSEVIKKVAKKPVVKVIPKLQGKYYRPRVNIKYDPRVTSRQRRQRAREAYRNFRK